MIAPFEHIEVLMKGEERFEARLVVADGRMEVAIFREDGTAASGPSRYRHRLAATETWDDVMLRVQIAISLFCLGTIDNPELGALRVKLSTNVARANREQREQAYWAVPVPGHLPEHPWFGRGIALRQAEWLACTLACLGEAPLPSGGHRGVDVIRCACLPSFHPPFCVRVSGPPAYARRGAFGGGQADRPSLDREVLGAVSAEQWARLRRQVESVRREIASVEDAAGLDGETWLVEAHVGGLSLVATRWSPGPGPFAELCSSMMARLP